MTLTMLPLIWKQDFRFFNEANRKNEKLILEIISSQAITAFPYNICTAMIRL